MSQPLQLEFRVVGGLHHGARATIEPGRYSLGRALSCDFILCDTGVGNRHGELQVETDNWCFQPFETDADIHTTAAWFPLGFGITIGEAVITVDHVEAPWIVHCEPTLVAQTVQVESEEEASPAIGAAAITMKSSSNDCKSSWRVATVGVASLAAISSLALFAAPELTPPAAAVPEAATSGSENSQVADIATILTMLKVSDRAKIVRRADGNLQVNATVMNDVEYEALAAALSRLSPRPGLRISDERELIRSVLQAVAAEEDGVACEYLGNGRFRLTGHIVSPGLRNVLPAKLSSGFPGILSIDDKRMTRIEMAERLLGLLRDAGQSGVRGQWSDEVFVIDLPAGTSGQATLMRVLADADREFGRWLNFSVTSPTRDVVLSESSLPFRPSTVVGGATPYVVLGDGAKIAVGGHIGAWKLVEIDRERLRFDGPRQISLPR